MVSPILKKYLIRFLTKDIHKSKSKKHNFLPFDHSRNIHLNQSIKYYFNLIWFYFLSFISIIFFYSVLYLWLFLWMNWCIWFLKMYYKFNNSGYIALPAICFLCSWECVIFKNLAIKAKLHHWALFLLWILLHITVTPIINIIQYLSQIILA